MTSQATEPNTAEAALNRLIAGGYRFVHPRDADGEVVEVVGVRAHGPVIDVVRIGAEDEVEATRMPGDEVDILAPQKVLWSRSGQIKDVVDGLLSLADGEHSGANPEHPSGCWIPGESGKAKFLLAS